MLRVVLVYAENGVCAEVWDKLGVGKSFRRLWSGKQSKNNYSWIEEMLEDDTYCCCCCQVSSVVSDSVRPHRRQPRRLPRPWDSPGKNTGVGCHFLLRCRKVKIESEVTQSCPTLSNLTPWTAAYQAPLSMGFSRQEHWSGVPLPSPRWHLDNVKWKK